MAKYVTRQNPITNVIVEIVDRKTRMFEDVTVHIIDLPADGKNPSRRANAIRKAVENAINGRDAVIMGVKSVEQAAGFYRMKQEDFLKYAEYVDTDDIESDDSDE